MTKVWAKQLDIARKAEVSIATVDRVINNRAGVNVLTAKRIWAAIDEIQDNVIPKKPLLFDVIIPDSSNIFLNNLANSIVCLGKSYIKDDITVKCHRVKGFKPHALAKLMKKISTNTDGIVVMPMEDPYVREVINNICTNGIPVVTIVSGLSTQRIIGHVGPNNLAVGRTAAQLINLMLHNKKGKVALLKGSQIFIYSDHQERELGFINGLRKYAPDLEILNIWETQDKNEEAYKKTKELLNKNNDIVAIYSVGGGSRGIGRALQELKKNEKIIWIGHELTEYSREFLLDGTMNAVINQDANLEARNALQYLINHYRGDENSQQPEEIQIGVYIRENLP